MAISAKAEAQQPTSSTINGPRGWPVSTCAPRWMVWTPTAAILWALAYGLVRVWWTIHGAPSFGKLGFDLFVFSGWSAVGLCVAAALIALALKMAPWWWPLLVTAWGVCAAFLVACPLLLLDMVGGLLPGMGVAFYPVAFLSRTACLIEGLLVGFAAVGYRRRWRSACLFCGGAGVRWRPAKPPRWAWWAAYAALCGCLVRLGAQTAVGFGVLQMHGRGIRLQIEGLIFEAAFLLAGTLLPLALVHPWGRIVPRWMPLLAGRRVPRWLPLGPALAISGLMTVYFGLTMAKIAAITLNHTAHQDLGSFPLAFFWVAVPGYFVWGVGVGVAAISYYQITRPLCRRCGL